MPASATKILIIDDDADLVSLLTDNLQLEGFSPSPAYNGEDRSESTRLNSSH